MSEQGKLTPKISAANFTPPPSGGKPRRKFRLAWVAAGFVVLSVAWVLFFLVTAVSLRVTTSPESARIEIDGGVHFRVADSYLLRPGNYSVSVSAGGYAPSETQVLISESQDIEFNLEALPGSLELRVLPDDIDDLEVWIGESQFTGANPLQIEDLAPGNYSVVVDAPLYESKILEVKIQGLGISQELNTDLVPAWANVMLQSIPPEVNVIDSGGRILGQTPLEIRLEEGSANLQLEKVGYQTARIELELIRGASLNPEPVQLLPLESRLSLTSTPSGAAVVIDEQYRGETPLQIDLLPERNYQLRLFKAGYSAHESQIRLNQGEDREISQQLSEVTGQLVISVSPPDAEIWIDGRRVASGSTELRLNTVNHQIEVRKEGYRSQSREFLPLQNQQHSLSFNLLTEAEAVWAGIPQHYQFSGHQFLLFRDAGLVELGSSRREPNRRANEMEWTADLQRAFYVSTHEVTNGQYRRFDPEHSSGNFARMSLDGTNQPVVGITWQEAALYCNWLSEQAGLPAFYQTVSGFVSGSNPEATGYRLLTEAEWTWVATLTSSQLKRIYPWGNEENPQSLDNFAGQEIAGNLNFTLAIRDPFGVTAPVGSFPPNDKGMYDIGGNVSEYLHDWYAAEAPSSETLTDPLGPSEGEYHVIRGASWSRGYLPQLRLAYRDYDAVGRNDVGFRIARYAR